MDLRVLEYFLAVARAGNITKAAEQLHVTQPTMSRQLVDLEKEVGAELLTRKKRQVTLTEAGVLFQQRAEEVVSLMKKTRRDIANIRDSVGGTVVIGCVESRVSRMLPGLIKDFSGIYPAVRFEIYSADGDDIREKMDRGELDFGFLLEPIEVAKYDYLRLPCWDIWGLLMRRDDPLAEKEFLTAQDVVPLPLLMPRREIVRDSMAAWLGIDRSQFNFAAGGNLINNMSILVEAGLGYMVCVGGCFEIRKTNHLCFVPIMPERTAGHVMAWNRGRAFHPSAQKFLEFVRERRAL